MNKFKIYIKNIYFKVHENKFDNMKVNRNVTFDQLINTNIYWYSQ